jgi:hypothetical protein
LGEHDRIRDRADAAVDQGDIGGGHRRACAGGHSDAEVGGREGGRVVDAVADHRDRAALTAQPVHERGLAGGRQLVGDPSRMGGSGGGGGGYLEGVSGGQAGHE